MKQVTLGQLRTRARALADQEAGVQQVDDDELDAHINSSIAQWYDMVSTADPERFGVTDTITADGSDSYALPTDHYKTLGIDYLDGSYWIPLERVTVQSRLNNNSVAGKAYQYRFWGGTVILEPKPSSGTYRHLYIPVAPELNYVSDVIDGVNGWEEWITHDAAIKMLIKEETSPSWLIRERARIQESIEVAAQERDMAEAGCVVDTQHRTRDYRYYRDSEYYEV